MSSNQSGNHILSKSDRQRMDSILVAFDVEWTQELLAEWIRDLPPLGSELRQAILIELIKVDIERQWQHGRPVTVEDYLRTYPELGDGGTIPASLILVEFEARKRWGSGSELSTFAARFPDQIDAVQRRMQQRDEPTEPRQTSPPDAGDLAIPGYEILGVLGKGGMGIVYKARQYRLDRIVALKMILRGGHASCDELTRFHREMEAAARLQHPGIVQIYEVGEHEGVPFCVLEFCPGGNLAQRLDETTLPPLAAGELVEQLARAIHEAHQHQIIHRDLKPDNVLFVDDPVTPLHQSRAKITDFGLAKELDAGTGHTQSGAILGTPSYMAPEQADGRIQAIGPATDVYSLGAILYECLTGRPPFKGATVPETLLQVLHEEPVPPRHIQQHTPRDLETICLKCLHKQPAQRYAGAADLADDLERYRKGLPIQARRVGRPERLWRWSRRHPALAVMAMSVLLLLMVVAGISSVASLWLYQEQRETLKQLEKRTAAENKAKEAEKETKRQLFFSKLAQAKAVRMTGLDGQRFNSLKLLNEAAAMLPLVGRDDTVLFQLRNEYIACSALPADLRVVHERKTGSPIYLGPEFEHYLYTDAKGDLHLCKRKDDQEIAMLPCARFVDAKDYYWGFRCSPDFRFLAIRYNGSSGRGYCLLWNLKTQKMLLKISMRSNCFPLDFAPNNLHVVFQTDQTNVLSRFDPVNERALPDIPQFRGVTRFLRYRPDGKQLAASFTPNGGVSLVDGVSGKSSKGTMTCEPNPFNWSPDSQFLALPVGMEIVVRDPRRDKIVAGLKGHDWFGISAGWARRHDLLWSHAWDGSSRLWHPFTGQELVRTNDNRTAQYFSACDKYLSFLTLAGSGGVWEVNHSRILRHLPVSAGASVERHCVAIHPKGRLLACGSNKGLHLCDLRTGREIGILKIGSCYSVQFHPVSGKLFTATNRGIFAWTIDFHEQANSFRLGFPVSYLKTFSKPFRRHAALTPDGHFLAMTAGGQVAVRDLEKNTHNLLEGQHGDAKGVTISPEGKWVVTFNAWGLKLWDVPQRKIVKDLLREQRSSFAKFSPDGRWLVASFRGAVRVWDTGTWELVRTTEGEIPIDDCAFSPRTNLMALNVKGGKVRLFTSPAGEELAALESTVLGWKLAFDTNGTQLAQASLNGPAAVWDLRQLRHELSELELDWDMPPLTPAQPPEAPTDTLQIEGVDFTMGVFALMTARVDPQLYAKTFADFQKRFFNPTAKQFRGELTNTDPYDRFRKKSRYKVYTHHFDAGCQYVIELKSKKFDTFLRLEDSNKKMLAFNDDIDLKNKNLNSRLIFLPKQTGDYRIIVTSYEPSVGDYTLSIWKGSTKKAGQE